MSRNGVRRREEVFNTHLAILLRGENLDAIEEGRTSYGGVPDVVVDLDGARVLIEAKFEGPGAERNLREQVRERLQKDPNTAAVLEVIYPDSLRSAEGAPEDNLRQSQLRWGHLVARRAPRRLG